LSGLSPSGAPLFSSTHQPANSGRVPVKERHRGVITKAQDILAGSLEEVAAAMVDIALGNAVEHLINHKTGEVHEVKVQPATMLKAQVAIADRVMGKPEQTKTHEIGEGAAGLFKVMLGASAEAHWERVNAPAEPPALEAAFAPALAEGARDE
jgi:hypothetical protein